MSSFHRRRRVPKIVVDEDVDTPVIEVDDAANRYAIDPKALKALINKTIRKEMTKALEYMEKDIFLKCLIKEAIASLGENVAFNPTVADQITKQVEDKLDTFDKIHAKLEKKYMQTTQYQYLQARVYDGGYVNNDELDAGVDAQQPTYPFADQLLVHQGS